MSEVVDLDEPTEVTDWPHRRFLQTALFVDDAALSPASPTEPQRIQKPPGRLVAATKTATVPHDPAVDPGESDVKPVTAEADRAGSHALGTDDETAPAVESRQEVDVDITRDIVEGFADVGVTCAVLAPDKLGASRREQIDRLARRTDILILDWNIDGGGAPQLGEDVDPTTIGLIERIIQHDVELGGRLRLIAIYTSESQLQPIRDDLVEMLETYFSEAELVVQDDAISNRHLCISLYQKPLQNDAAGLPTGLAPGELVQKVLQDFDAVAANGLLQQLALSVLSRVRDQASRVVSRFDSRLDPALIAHRAQTSHRDAIVFALALLGSELSSLVRTADISSVMSEAMVAKHVERLIGSGSRRLWLGGDEIVDKPNQLTQKFLTLAGADNSMSDMGISKRAQTVSSLLIDAADDDALRSSVRDVEHAFAILCCSERSSAFDGHSLARPSLEFGVLVENDDEYLLCLQPVCDSVRVDKPKEFIFLPLRISPSPMSFDLIVLDGAGSVPLIPVGPSLASTRGISFLGDAQTQVVSAKRQGDARYFYTTDQQGYRWVANIREAFVRRLLASMIEDMTRVGLDESEFMQRRKK